jgi:Zinc-binding dehydrogenase
VSTGRRAPRLRLSARDGAIAPHVDRVFPLTEASAAHHYVRDRMDVGKVPLDRMPEPKQARSRETQGRIVAAALELVVELGREGPFAEVDELTALGAGSLGLTAARTRTATIPRPPLRVPALNR